MIGSMCVSLAAFIIDGNVRVGGAGAGGGIHVRLQSTREESKKMERNEMKVCDAMLDAAPVMYCMHLHAPCRASRESWRSFEGWGRER